MKPINVMVTGVGGGGVGEQILKCLKLSKLDYHIIGCDMNRTSMGLKEVDKAYLVPRATDENYIPCILKLCKDNDIKVLFHGSEPELKAFSNHREEFADAGVYVPLNSKDLIDICMDKNHTMRFLKSQGFEIQKYWEVSDESDLEKIDVFPVVLKPSVGGGGSANTFIAQNKYELKMFGRYLLSLYDQFISQEYVGDPEHEYTVGVICNDKGRYINSIAVKKSILSSLSNKMRIPNRTGREELGNVLAISSGISQGEIGRFPEVTVPSRKIAEALETTASINVQCRIHNGKMYVFEINPRISGTSSLRAMVGYNEPEMLIREKILGEQLEENFVYESGIIMRGLCEVYISSEFMKNGVIDMSEIVLKNSSSVGGGG